MSDCISTAQVFRHQRGLVGTLLLVILLLAAGAVALWWYAPPSSLTETPPWRVEHLPELPRPHAYLAIPYVIPVEQVKQTVREAISGQLFAKTIKVPKRDIKITVERNGPLVLRIKDARLRMELPIEFETEGDLDVDGELTIATNARFDIDPDWQPNLHVKTTFWWDDEPSVGFWPFLFDIGDKLQPFIQKALNEQSEKLMEQARSAYKLRAMAEIGWRQLQEPLALGHDGKRWLLLRPGSAWVEPVTNDKDDIYVNFWIGADPMVVEGPRPQPGDPLPLPDLHKGMPPARNLVLDYPLTLSYPAMTRAASEQLEGRRIGLPQGWVDIRKVQIYPSGRDLAVSIEYNARGEGQWLPSSGRVTLLGTPLYDPSRQRLSLNDLHLAPPQPHWWNWRQRWVAQPRLVQQVGAALVWPVGDRVTAAAGQMNTELAGVKGRNFELWGGVNKTVPTRVQLNGQGMALQLRSVGDMSVMITP